MGEKNLHLVVLRHYGRGVGDTLHDERPLSLTEIQGIILRNLDDWMGTGGMDGLEIHIAYWEE